MDGDNDNDKNEFIKDKSTEQYLNDIEYMMHDPYNKKLMFFGFKIPKNKEGICQLINDSHIVDPSTLPKNKHGFL